MELIGARGCVRPAPDGEGVTERMDRADRLDPGEFLAGVRRRIVDGRCAVAVADADTGRGSVPRRRPAGCCGADPRVCADRSGRRRAEPPAEGWRFSVARYFWMARTKASLAGEDLPLGLGQRGPVLDRRGLGSELRVGRDHAQALLPIERLLTHSCPNPPSNLFLVPGDVLLRHVVRGMRRGDNGTKYVKNGRSGVSAWW